MSYKIAQQVKQELLDSDLKSQQYSFQLLSAYMQKLHLQALEVYTDLIIDSVTDEFSFLLCFLN